MRILIVDDEPLARDRLGALIGDIDAGEVVATAGNGIDAIALTRSHAPDLVLLDIRMPGMDGIETAHHLAKLESAPAVVFTTAYDEHALAAFDANAIDYLLKPIRVDRLKQAIVKVRQLRPSAPPAVEALERERSRTHLSGYVGGNLMVIAIERVIYLQADQGYTEVVWADGSMLIEESLKSLETEFNDRFTRVHRSALVAIEHIDGLVRDATGQTMVSIAGSDTKLPVSRRLLSQVRALLT